MTSALPPPVASRACSSSPVRFAAPHPLRAPVPCCLEIHAASSVPGNGKLTASVVSQTAGHRLWLTDRRILPVHAFKLPGSDSMVRNLRDCSSPQLCQMLLQVCCGMRHRRSRAASASVAVRQRCASCRTPQRRRRRPRPSAGAKSPRRCCSPLPRCVKACRCRLCLRWVPLVQPETAGARRCAVPPGSNTSNCQGPGSGFSFGGVLQ